VGDGTESTVQRVVGRDHGVMRARERRNDGHAFNRTDVTRLLIAHSSYLIRSSSNDLTPRELLIWKISSFSSTYRASHRSSRHPIHAIAHDHTAVENEFVSRDPTWQLLRCTVETSLGRSASFSADALSIDSSCLVSSQFDTQNVHIPILTLNSNRTCSRLSRHLEKSIAACANE
jgi:hypothetical protein